MRGRRRVFGRRALRLVIYACLVAATALPCAGGVGRAGLSYRCLRRLRDRRKLVATATTTPHQAYSWLSACRVLRLRCVRRRACASFGTEPSLSMRCARRGFGSVVRRQPSKHGGGVQIEQSEPTTHPNGCDVGCATLAEKKIAAARNALAARPPLKAACGKDEDSP